MWVRLRIRRRSASQWNNLSGWKSTNLNYFWQWCLPGGLTRAARERGLSPGAVSQQIQRLSAELGVPLFFKAGRGIALTPEGSQFAERSRVLLKDVDDLRRCFTLDASSDRTPFHLATGATTLIHGLGKPLRALRRKYPKAAIRVTVANTEEMVEGLLSRRFDLAIVS